VPVSIKMPQLGESVSEGTIGKWLKAQGDEVARDEPLVEIITDKVTAEMPSPAAGRLNRVIIADGMTVPVGTEIAVIESVEAVAHVDASAPEMDADIPSEAETEDDESRAHRASPLVRRLAREHNLDISVIAGTGTGGRVTKNDVLNFLEQRPSKPAPEARPATAKPIPAPTAVSAEAPTRTEVELLPLTPMRRTIADHMARSTATIPHAWSLVEVDATPLVKLREHLRKEWSAREGYELTYLPFFIKAVTEALREHAMMNGRWTDLGVELSHRISIGLAVSLEDGLIVPVIQDADRLSVAGLAAAVRDIVGRARQHQLTPTDVQGATFTVNNTGALGSVMSAPIIPVGQAGIITMESIVKRPVVRDDAIAIRSMMNVCLSFDHRVTDGAEALQFLQNVRRRLEHINPDSSTY
jgi:2-oxoisovalerate dehydrogenase E2 component (dihydrolipoyl transacylase)